MTLSKSVLGTYELCPVCYWEDDWQQSQNPDQNTGANQVSLNRAKLNFRLCGASEERFIGNVRRPKENERPREKEKPREEVVAVAVVTEEAEETKTTREVERNGAERSGRAEKVVVEAPPPPPAPSREADRKPIELSAVRDAVARIAPFAHVTPVVSSSYMDSLVGRALFFKCETFQKVGAFKFRGACNAVMKLPADVAKRGVVTHSSGNHAQALALAAKLRGIQAHIVMPNTSPIIKCRAVEGYGGRVVLCDPTQAAREAAAAEVVDETGGTLIPPYNHPDIIAGQGTVALELLEQLTPPGVDAIIAPIGGGGLISGICIAAHGMNKKIKVIAAEPAGADDAARSKASGQLLQQTSPKTMADGLLTSMGDLTWPIVRDHVDRVITVSEDRIAAAMRLVFERMKLVIEPSAAVAVAAVLSDEFKTVPGIRRAAIVLSGGNVDLERLPW
ncbi:MAG: pyridoxal-phosphate dependent enzyme [Phycisphaerales bacterium]|nr:pyridoxal-phosphate dependent enzyme [Phycisphaerales bacterium]MCI0630855.1 pyridoxal-phosphate dependent enzyme [Phycisphaerales bacterium]MCI0674667.1 pyridoxal-phosphate dependent enzyme [Phycisphaerales bacterium]